jgi:hypothetical protein
VMCSSQGSVVPLRQAGQEVLEAFLSRDARSPFLWETSHIKTLTTNLNVLDTVWWTKQVGRAEPGCTLSKVSLDFTNWGHSRAGGSPLPLPRDCHTL